VANEVLVKTGSSIIWDAAATNYAMTMAGILNTEAREGAKGDLGATRAARWAVRVSINMDAAPTNGLTIELWWTSSTSATAGTDNTGGCSGTDADWTGTAGGGVAQTKYQLQHIGDLVLTADADTVVQVAEFTFYPLQRYGAPVLVNLSGQTLEGDDDSHQIELVPIIDEVQ
jgi:hypothetical protein